MMAKIIAFSLSICVDASIVIVVVTLAAVSTLPIIATTNIDSSVISVATIFCIVGVVITVR